ncbi:tryptophan--tRNA ligase [Acetobacterium tundrae]|uniref:Tryptophan--tRNA ligase n=1 Tax=Acetobacterium tundrae TaxID=132932 RepID=A0ABR6WLN2_9FIRM|nr:tryptophan--tRNA ligase [Acetobacterium tundrae]MBC3797201.1 tryptophan--tRNA ligase [Acetobacterium tundrae]
METPAKKIVYSGIQPSGTFTIGNYFGAMKNWVKLQEDYQSIFCVVDLHAITMPQNPADLRRRTYESMALLLALGIDPEKSILYVQSMVPEHAELTWILNCCTYMGELSRMTQFKDKAQKQGENIRVGLFDYPVLMAADILLYQTDLVPVGNDQRQHVELARDIATRFNQQYGDVFKIPEAYFGESGARIMSLQDPTKKMSKSDENLNGFISLLDDPKTIVKKFKRAITDSEMNVHHNREEKPGVSNLMEIYSCATGKSLDAIAQEFEGKGYGDFKLVVGEAVAETIIPVQTEYQRLLKEKDYLNTIMHTHAEKASMMAWKTLAKARKKVGFVTV